MQLRNWSYVLAGLVLQYASAEAANLVTNPDFTSDINGWVGSALSWDSSDGDPSPGSAHAVCASPGNAGNSACIVIAAPQSIDFFAKIKVASGEVAVNVFSFTDTNCTTNPSAFAFIPITAPSTWQQFSDTNIALPNGTNSVSIQLVCAPPGGSTDAHFDHILFGPSGSAPVRLQTFDVK